MYHFSINFNNFIHLSTYSNILVQMCSSQLTKQLLTTNKEYDM